MAGTEPFEVSRFASMQASLVLAVLTVVAIFLGPVVALWLQRKIEERRVRHDRKLAIFKELMATRSARASPRHVDALNAIEVEFSSGDTDDTRVLRAWRLYLDHLNTDGSADVARWTDKGNDLLTDLLYEMSQALNYDFDKLALKRNIYSPEAHCELESDQYLLRKYIVEMMAGKRAIWAGVFTGEKPVDIRLGGTTQDPVAVHPSEPRP